MTAQSPQHGEQEQSPRRKADAIASNLVGDECLDDDCNGYLEKGEYKDNVAILCEECGTPRVQVW